MSRRPAAPVSLLLAALAAAGLAASPGPAAADGPLTALTGATLHPVSAPPIAGGVLLIEGTTIQALGDGSLPVPAEATVVDLAGKHLYPGFVHPLASLGLVEIESVRGTLDAAEIGEVNSNLRAEVAFHADSLHLPVAISGGVLTAHVAPAGGVFRGTSAVMRLEGWNWEDMTLAAPVGMHLAYPRTAGGDDEGEGGGEEGGLLAAKALEVIADTVADARAYGKARAAADAGQAPAVAADPRLEALLPVLAGDLPLFLHAPTKNEIEKALDWAAEEGIERVVLVTGSDAAYVAERLAADGVPVILRGVLVVPERDFEPYDWAYTAPARLHQAGVRFAIADEGDVDESMNARNLPFHAAMAAAFGLPREAALGSVTLAPAEILGVADRVGSLEPGKEATFFVADGDPLEIRTEIERAWIAGREVEMSEDHQKRLYEKYRDRPRR